MILNILLIIVGFVFLIKGADWLVSGAAGLAKKHHVSDLVIGLTIVSLGTSMPELVVNAFSSFQGHSDLIYGNIIGSNIFNLFVILGITALIYPISVKSSLVKKEIPISFLLILLVMLFSNAVLWQSDNILTRWEGVVFLVLFLIFMYYTFRQPNEDGQLEENITTVDMSEMKIWGLILIGLILLVIGGRFVVDNAVAVAKLLGLSEKIIGLTVVAAGTSLPELVTSVIAASKKKSDIAIGNVIGSNIMNILLILGISGVLNPIPFNIKFNLELVMLAVGTLLVILFTFTDRKKTINRWQGGVLFAIFLIYTFYMVRLEV